MMEAEEGEVGVKEEQKEEKLPQTETTIMPTDFPAQESADISTEIEKKQGICGISAAVPVSKFYGTTIDQQADEEPSNDELPIMSVPAIETDGCHKATLHQLPTTMDDDDYMKAYAQMLKETPPASSITVGSSVDYVDNGILFTTKIASMSPSTNDNDDGDGAMLYYGEWSKPKEKYFRTVGMRLDELIAHVDRPELQLPDMSSIPRGNVRNKFIGQAANLKDGDCVTTVDGSLHVVHLNYSDLKVLVSSAGIAFSYLKLLDLPKPLTAADLAQKKSKKRIRGVSPATSQNSTSSAASALPKRPKATNVASSSKLAKKQMVDVKVGPNRPLPSTNTGIRRRFHTGTPRKRSYPSWHKCYQQWLNRWKPSFLRKFADEVVTKALKVTTADSLTMQSAFEGLKEGLKEDMKNEFQSIRQDQAQQLGSVEKKLRSLFDINRQTTPQNSSCLRCTQIDPIGHARHIKQLSFGAGQSQPLLDEAFCASTPIMGENDQLQRLDPLLSSAAISPLLYDETDIAYEANSETTAAASTEEMAHIRWTPNEKMVHPMEDAQQPRQLLTFSPKTDSMLTKYLTTGGPPKQDDFEKANVGNFYGDGDVAMFGGFDLFDCGDNDDGAQLDKQRNMVSPPASTANKTGFEDIGSSAATLNAAQNSVVRASDSKEPERVNVPPDLDQHVLLDDWCNPMPREQPFLQVRRWSDYCEVQFAGEVKLTPDMHMKAFKESIAYAKSATDQMEKRIKKGKLVLDPAEKKKRAVAAKWIGYVNSALKYTTGIDLKKERILYIEGDKTVSSEMVKTKLKSTADLISNQPEPVSTVLDMCWKNVFAVHKKTGSDTFVHDVAVKTVIKQLQSQNRQGRRRNNKTSQSGNSSGDDSSLNSSFFEDE